VRQHGSDIGYNSGSGMVTVDGTGSTWNSGALDVGISGSGTLSITNGGKVSNGVSGFGEPHNTTIGIGTGSRVPSPWMAPAQR